MKSTVEGYLRKRTMTDRWPLLGQRPGACRSVVVIPALGEFPGLFETLADLASCAGSSETFVLVVVNNLEPETASADDIAANQRTLAALQAWDQDTLHVAWLDACSPGHELPPGEGVGLARKLGLDLGLQLLADQDRLQSPLVCLDGDTRVDERYLEALHRFFAAPSRWAGVLPYAHPIEGDTSQQAAILCYELFLRYHSGQLTWAGSPYGYHAIGSAMACTASAYAAVSGMNRRQAGEDFYFLQQLAKTGSIETVPGTVVKPSGRASHRVPFGTGRRVLRFLDADGEGEYLLYDPRSYDVIRRWLEVAGAHAGRGSEQMLSEAGEIHDGLRTFLVDQGFARAWDRLLAHASSDAALAAQFHRWFDGLRTVRCIHHLRDTVWPDISMFDAIGVLLHRRGQTPGVQLDVALCGDLPRQKQLLEQLRSQEMER